MNWTSLTNQSFSSLICGDHILDIDWTRIGGLHLTLTGNKKYYKLFSVSSLPFLNILYQTLQTHHPPLQALLQQGRENSRASRILVYTKLSPIWSYEPWITHSFMKRYQCYSAQKSFMGGWWWWWIHCNYSFKLQVQVSYYRFKIDLGLGHELDNYIYP